jgi:hypothetical protein
LGLGVGRDGIDSGDTDYRGAAGGLRPYGILEADWAVVERVKQRAANSEQRADNSKA